MPWNVLYKLKNYLRLNSVCTAGGNTSWVWYLSWRQFVDNLLPPLVTFLVICLFRFSASSQRILPTYIFLKSSYFIKTPWYSVVNGFFCIRYIPVSLLISSFIFFNELTTALSTLYILLTFKQQACSFPLLDRQWAENCLIAHQILCWGPFVRNGRSMYITLQHLSP